VPNFKHLCDSIPELLNVFFEDPTQRVHTIPHIKICTVLAGLGPFVYHLRNPCND